MPEPFKIGDKIEHKLMPGFVLTVLETAPCETDSARPHEHLQYRITEPEGNDDWLCHEDVQRPSERLEWGGRSYA